MKARARACVRRSVTRLVDADALKRKSTGLEGALGALKKKKLSSMAKSHIDWQQFKSAAGLDDELRNANKAGYLEQQAFLERADWRQFAHEKSVRDVARKQRAAAAAAGAAAAVVTAAH